MPYNHNWRQAIKASLILALYGAMLLAAFSAPVTRILPLGDSLTWGYPFHDTHGGYDPGTIYHIEHSTNLKDWHDAGLGAVSGPGPVLRVNLPNSDEEQNFYRLRSDR